MLFFLSPGNLLLFLQLGEAEVNGHLQELMDEEMFELDETENSLVRRKVPAICQGKHSLLNFLSTETRILCVGHTQKYQTSVVGAKYSSSRIIGSQVFLEGK